MEIARAVILATPSADDLPWSSVGAWPKPLAPVATRPVLFHALDALRGAGVLEAALLTGPETSEIFTAAVGDGSRWGMSIRHAPCDDVVDVGAALGVMREFVDDEPVLVQRADALLRELRRHVVGFARRTTDALALMLTRTAAADADPPLAGGYLLSPAAVAMMVNGSAIGSDPVVWLRRHGSDVRVLDVDGCLACHGGEASLLEANRHALTGIRTKVDGAEIRGSEIQGQVIVHPTATLHNTVLRGPAIIGARARIANSYIGPYSSIGAGVHIEGTEIEHSIVMDDARLLFVGSRLETSIIGRGASIERRFSLPAAVRMSIGDGAHVALG